VVLLAATFGYWLVALILEAVGIDTGIVVPILSIAGAVAFGLLAWFGSFERIIVIVATALIGAALMVIGLLFVTGQFPVDAFRAGLSALSLSLQFAPLWIALMVILAIAGALTQFLAGGRSEDRSEGEEIAEDTDAAPGELTPPNEQLAAADDMAAMDDAADANDAADAYDAYDAYDAAGANDDLAMAGGAAVAASDAGAAPEPIVMDDEAIMDDLEAMDDLEPPPSYDDIT
jgi:hypothetical protein